MERYRDLKTVRRDELTARQREMISLHFDRGLTLREISRQLGISATTVCRTVARAKERLRHTLE